MLYRLGRDPQILYPVLRSPAGFGEAVYERSQNQPGFFGYMQHGFFAQSVECRQSLGSGAGVRRVLDAIRQFRNGYG